MRVKRCALGVPMTAIPRSIYIDNISPDGLRERWLREEPAVRLPLPLGEGTTGHTLSHSLSSPR